MRLLLTLLALLTGLSAPSAHAGVRADIGAGIEQVEAGQRAGVMAATLVADKLQAAKRIWRGIKPVPAASAPDVVVPAVEHGDRALE